MSRSYAKELFLKAGNAGENLYDRTQLGMFSKSFDSNCMKYAMIVNEESWKAVFELIFNSSKEKGS